MLDSPWSLKIEALLMTHSLNDVLRFAAAKAELETLARQGEFSYSAVASTVPTAAPKSTIRAK